MSDLGKSTPLRVQPGTNPEPDSTESGTVYFTATDKVDFFQNRLRKIPGWQEISDAGEIGLYGCARTLFTYVSDNLERKIIGTNTRLMVHQAGVFYNITPLQASVNELGSDPVSVTNTSNVVTYTLTSHGLTVGEEVIIYNVDAAVGGIPQSELNGTYEVNTVPTANTFTIVTSTSATSTTSGGGSTVKVITPDTATLGSNPIESDYNSLGTDPITTTDGSEVIQISLSNHWLIAGDSVTISGSSAVNGIPAGEINATHEITSVPDANTIEVAVTTEATSSGSGGGGSVVWASPTIRVTKTSHGYTAGDRIRLANSAAVGGVPAASINIEHIIRQVLTADTFTVNTDTDATSAVTGGGSSVTIQEQISPGPCDFAPGEGFGGGLYGVGLYGVPKLFTNQFQYPRIWSVEKFGDDLMVCPGNGGKVYVWNHSTANAPTILRNAPTKALWIFQSNNSLGVLGADDVDNRVHMSDTGNATIWSTGPATNAYIDDIEDARLFVSQARARSINLLFGTGGVFAFQFAGKPDLWLTRRLMGNDGLIGPKARATIDDTVFFMGGADFYVFDGSELSRLPNNTCKRYIFDNLNDNQKWKVFCRPVPEFNQVWWFFPTGTSNEPNEYVIYQWDNKSWTLGKMDRTAAEEPRFLDVSRPYMVNSQSETVEGSFYRHHIGDDDADSAMTAYAETSYPPIGQGDVTFNVWQFEPDGTQTGNLDVTYYTKLRSQGTTDERTFGPFAVTQTTELLDVSAHGRYRKIRFEQDALGETFTLGAFKEVIQQDTAL